MVKDEGGRREFRGIPGTPHSIPIRDYDQIPAAVINFVKITEKSVVINDAGKDPTFESDPYILKHSPRSILCIPLMRQSELQGILYLENRFSSHVFSDERVESIASTSSDISGGASAEGKNHRRDRAGE